MPSDTPSCDMFYSIPTTRVQRTTSLGIGDRDTAIPSSKTASNLAVSSLASSWATSVLRSDFDYKPARGGVYSFGGRHEETNKRSVHRHIGSQPGPGTYELRSLVGTDALKYSFHAKLPGTGNDAKRSSHSIEIQPGASAPGPGTFLPPPTITPKGEQFLSTYQNSRATLFSSPRSSRFEELRTRVS